MGEWDLGSGSGSASASTFNVPQPTGNTVLDTLNIQNTYNAAYAAGGGVVAFGAGTWSISQPINWASGLVHCIGVGDASVIAVVAPIAEAFNITIPGGGRGLFQDFLVECNGNVSTAGMYQHIAVENSVGTKFVRVHVNGATSPAYQFANDLCEDCTYTDCMVDGNENSTTTVNRAIRFNIPNGMCRVVGGELFGRNDINAQQMEYVGAVAGPFNINNASALNGTVLALQGCYIYDGGVDGQNCIDTATNLCNVTADGCYFVAQNQTTFVNGNIPAGVAIALRNCIYIQAIAGATLNIASASGAGVITAEGGAVVASGVTLATTINLFIGVASPTTTALMPIVISGVTNPGTTRYSAPTLGAAAQVSTTLDQEISIAVTTAGQLKVAIGPTNAVAETILNATAVVAGQVVSFRLPAAFFVAVTTSSTAVWSASAIACAG